MSQIYFWNKTLHVSDSSFVHHQEYFTVHTAMVYVIQVCWQQAVSMVYVVQVCWQLASSSQAVSKRVWHTQLLCVQWNTPDDGRRNCPKRAEFYSKNKFEKSVHIVGFIVRIYRGARSSESQTYVETLRHFQNSNGITLMQHQLSKANSDANWTKTNKVRHWTTFRVYTDWPHTAVRGLAWNVQIKFQIFC